MDSFIIDVPSVVSSLGIDAKNMSGRLKACCPFHKEKTPSWYIELDDPYRFHCFGCGESGNIFSLYTRITGRDFYKDYGLDKGNYQLFSTMQKPRVFGEIKQRKIDSIEGELLLPYDNQEVMAYLLNRNTQEPITKEFLEYYNIKYTIQAEINRPKEEKERGTFFNHRLTVPIIENKIMVGLEGRSYNGGKPKVLYPKNSSVDTLLGIDNLSYDEPLYLAEGVFHLPGLFKLGLRNISCVFGASISPRQIALLQKFKKIIFFPDNDEAGQKALKTLAGGYEKDSLYVGTIPLEYDKSGKPVDLGDLTVKEIEKIISNSLSYIEYQFDKIDPFDKKNQQNPSNLLLKI